MEPKLPEEERRQVRRMVEEIGATIARSRLLDVVLRLFRRSSGAFLQYGTFDKDCMILAELCSQAVDYPKNGVPVDVEKVPSRLIHAKPDWKKVRGDPRCWLSSLSPLTLVSPMLNLDNQSRRTQMTSTGWLYGRLALSSRFLQG